MGPSDLAQVKTLKRIRDALRHLPLAACIQDAKQLHTENGTASSQLFTRWTRLVEGLWEDDAASVSRARVLQDGIFAKEVRRISAMLAVAELNRIGSQQIQDDHNKDTRDLVRTALIKWVNAIRRASDDEGDLYFQVYLTASSESSKASVVPDDLDPYSHQIDLLGLDKQMGETTRLRAVFGPQSDAFALPLARWALRRYDFVLATNVWQAASPTEHKAWRHLRWQQHLLPRLLCCVLLGHFALLAHGGLMQFFEGVCRAGGCKAVLLALAIAALCFAVFCSLLAWEVRSRAPLRSNPSKAIRKIFWTGATASFVMGMGAVAVWSVTTPIKGAESPPPFSVSWWFGSILLLLVESAAALLLGYALQILWDDKSISDGF